MHYLQDLTQPFHAVQLPSKQMLRLGVLVSNLGNLGAFVRDTTRIVTNYHWAYEGITLEELRLGERSPLATCLKDFEKHANLQASQLSVDPAENARATARASVELGSAVGRGVIGAFGTGLKDSETDFAHGSPMPEFVAMALSNQPEILKLNEATCRALSNAILVSRRTIVDAAKNHSESSRLSPL